MLHLFVIVCYAQQNSSVTGVVTDKQTNEGIASVTCRVLDERGKITSYTITDVDGKYTLTISSKARWVEFATLGYEKKRIDVSQRKQLAQVKLQQQATTMKEVVVKLKPVDIHKDTINYNVAAFKDKNDRYIEDVLKKLPGVEVASTGQISYKGKPINKFNIEGQDLLGNQYNQATRNLSVEAVAQVQVMENDQPIRVLKDKVPSDQATLNIKLKKGYKSKPFGELVAGAGWENHTLWGNHTLWDGKLTLINIAPRNQIFVTAKTNNTGTDLSYDFQEQPDYTNLNGMVSTPSSWVSIGSVMSLPIPQARYYRNKSYSVGFNHLTKVNEVSHLRTNISYLESHQDDEDSTYYSFGGASTASLYESNIAQTKQWWLKPSFTFESNGSKVYLKNQLSASIQHQKNQSLTRSNASSMLNHLRSHPFYIQNNLRATVSIGKQMGEIASFVRYYQRSENLDVNDSLSSTPIYSKNQRVDFSRFYTRNQVKFAFPISRHLLSLSYQLAYRKDWMTINDVQPKRTVAYLDNLLTPEFSFRYDKGYVAASVPVHAFVSQLAWDEQQRQCNKFYLSPSLRWNHTFSMFWNMKIGASVTNNLSPDIPLRPTFYSGYRTQLTSLDRWGWGKSKNLSLSLNYTDLIRMFSWNLIATQSWNMNDHTSAYVYTDQYTIVQPLWRDMKSKQTFITSAITKKWHDAGLNLNTSLNYNRTQTPVVQNDADCYVRYNVISYLLTFGWNKCKWLQLNNQFTCNVSWQDANAYQQNTTLTSFYNVLRATLYPVSRLGVNLSWEHNLLELRQSHYYNVSFLDANLDYTISKRWMLSLKATNLLNKTAYQESSFTGLNYHYYLRPLRGREVVASLKVNF